MTRLRLPALSAALWSLLMLAPPALSAEELPAVSAAVEGFVRPAYQAFMTEGAALAASMDALCALPSEPALEKARREFRDAALAWGRAEVIRFGPAAEDNRLERVLFFPDRKGAGLRQVQAALAKEEASAADAGTLKKKSVAMQGLPALEFILWGAGAEALARPGAGFRCAYGRAVADNLAAIGAELDAAWDDPQGVAAVWGSPGPENALFRDRQEALGELVGAVVEGLERLRDQRLKSFIGETPEKGRPKQALFWRSGLTLAMAEANLGGLADLWETSGLGQSLPTDQGWIAQAIRFEFANARRAATELAEQPVEGILADAQAREKLGYLVLVTSSLSDIFGTQLSPALGLSTGFSSLDGD